MSRLTSQRDRQVLRQIRLLFLVNGFAIGGGEIKLLELVGEIVRKQAEKFHVMVCSVGQGGPLQKDFEALGIRTEVYPKKGPYDISLVWKVARLMRQERIDMVQTTLFYADVIGTLAARMAGVKHVVSWEAITEPYRRKHLLAYRLASKWFAVSVAVSEAIRRKVMDERHVPPRKAVTIHYGVDPRRFRPGKSHSLRKELGLGRKQKILGTVARLTTQKGHCYLIEAASRIVEAYPEAHFVFAGDGPLRSELESQTRRVGLEDHIHFLGFRTDVRELMNDFDVFILPSLWEGLPNVVLEVMACGKPVVATAVDGTPEAVVHGQTGFLVPPRNPEALADAVIDILADERQLKAMGMRGRERIVQAFSLNKQIDAFVNLYEKLVLSLE
jgi:glycosyltransferase involved in cell wall biosynthesis